MTVDRWLVHQAQRARRAPGVRAARLDRLSAEIAHWSWYLLSVAPQAELAVEELLLRRAVPAFCPTRTQWRRVNRYARRKTEFVFPALPGYVLVGLAWLGDPRWSLALAPSPVRGVVGWGDAPRPLPERAVLWLGQLSSEAPAVERFMRSRAEFGAGDTVTVVEGAAEGLVGRVVGIEGRTARVLTHILGSERVVDCDLGRLARAAG